MENAAFLVKFLNLSINTKPVNTRKRTSMVLFSLILIVSNNAYAQLRRYLNDSPAKQEAFEKKLKKEASSIITKRTVAYGDTFSYDLMTFTLRSFDGQASKISLWEKPFDGHIFHIAVSGDSLIIPDFSGLL